MIVFVVSDSAGIERRCTGINHCRIGINQIEFTWHGKKCSFRKQKNIFLKFSLLIQVPFVNFQLFQLILKVYHRENIVMVLGICQNISGNDR